MPMGDGTERFTGEFDGLRAAIERRDAAFMRIGAALGVPPNHMDPEHIAAAVEALVRNDAGADPAALLALKDEIDRLRDDGARMAAFVMEIRRLFAAPSTDERTWAADILACLKAGPKPKMRILCVWCHADLGVEGDEALKSHVLGCEKAPHRAEAARLTAEIDRLHADLARRGGDPDGSPAAVPVREQDAAPIEVASEQGEGGAAEAGHGFVPLTCDAVDPWSGKPDCVYAMGHDGAHLAARDVENAVRNGATPPPTTIRSAAEAAPKSGIVSDLCSSLDCDGLASIRQAREERDAARTSLAARGDLAALREAVRRIEPWLRQAASLLGRVPDNSFVGGYSHNGTDIGITAPHAAAILAALDGTPSQAAGHRCGNCEGVDPASCWNAPVPAAYIVDDKPSPALSFDRLRSANAARHKEWWTAGVAPSLSFRGNELAGEVGEACNVIKKLDREVLGLRGSRSTKAALAEELADVIICADLIAMDQGIDLGHATAAKFNATSTKVGLSTRLDLAAPTGRDGAG